VPLSGDTASDVEQIKKTVETIDKVKKMSEKPKKKKIKKKEGEEVGGGGGGGGGEKKRRKPREKKKEKLMMDEDDDNADNCAAIKCLKPTGRNSMYRTVYLNISLFIFVQTKDYKISICCFSAKHTALTSKTKDWLDRNQIHITGRDQSDRQ
jgi:hypothetical protein